MVAWLLVVLLFGVVAQADDASQVCFVIRTYVGHADTYTQNSLPKLLSSLISQTDPRWQALIVVLDSRPYTDLAGSIRQLNDPRISIFAEWAGPNFAAQEADGTWKKTYHAQLYNLTDNAIRACPRSSRWVVATNGDNLYDNKLIEHLAAAPPEAHLLAVDFYSRYQRPTARPCTRFASTPDMPMCKVNELRFCQTDLAAMAFNLDRLIKEDRRFGLVDQTGNGEVADGLMAELLVSAGWQVHHVRHCLVHHHPNPQLCAYHGGVWDDSAMAEVSTFGGKCLTAAQKRQKMNADPDQYHVQLVSLSYDPDTFGLQEQGQLWIECMSRADGVWYGPYVFGKVCAARQDLASMPPDMPPHALDHMLPPDLR